MVREVVHYRITVKGVLGREWSDWFDGMVMTGDSAGQTELTGPIPDQAALHGLLAKIRDLGLTLLSVQLIEDKGVSNEVQSSPL
jgi:hypothetical protein